MISHCSATVFFNFKVPRLLKIKTSDFSVLMHFIVVWSVTGHYHYSHCYSFVCNNDDILLSGRQRQVGTAEN
jgi:hypothetical protein